ncbi:hypothetical protein C6V83_00275 [Gordonia iterans]|uniref:Secreted protein n=1 Tax=Gordonia iterans TaxID=1004901 RepID=A0A2S0KBB2_9ACTN|nr:hypothetical protein [Gordonia iterans]AVL98950.1 hypothetical protein C6V83_00275 [Gordonia iterans]
MAITASTARIVAGTALIVGLAGGASYAGPGAATAEPGSGIVDVDPAEYEAPGYPGFYTWKYNQGDGEQICSLSPAHSGTSPASVVCFGEYPAGTPDVQNGPFTGPPNSVVLTVEGVQPSLNEGGPATPRSMPANHRISAYGLTCTTLTPNGVECVGPAASFRIDDGIVTEARADG